MASNFSRPTFRVYTSNDVSGVEIGGAVKNVIAIAAGIVKAMELGDNTIAALVSRGLAEIMRLGARAGANPLTLSGLAGVGDLVVTCLAIIPEICVWVLLSVGANHGGSFKRIGTSCRGNLYR